MTSRTPIPNESSSGADQTARRDRNLPFLETVAVEARGLTKLFGTNRAVDDIDLTSWKARSSGSAPADGLAKTTMLTCWRPAAD